MRARSSQSEGLTAVGSLMVLGAKKSQSSSSAPSARTALSTSTYNGREDVAEIDAVKAVRSWIGEGPARGVGGCSILEQK